MRNRITILLLSLFCTVVAGCGNADEVVKQTVQDIASVPEGKDVLFKGTVLEELTIFETTMKETQKILSDHNLPYEKSDNEETIVTTILDNMSGLHCYYELSFISDDSNESLLAAIRITFFFQSDGEFREGLGEIKRHLGASVVEGYEMIQDEDPWDDSLSDSVNIGTKYVYPIRVMPVETVRNLFMEEFSEEDMSEEDKKMLEMYENSLEIAEVITIHGERGEPDMELVPEGYIYDVVRLDLRWVVTEEYKLMQDGTLSELHKKMQEPIDFMEEYKKAVDEAIINEDEAAVDEDEAAVDEDETTVDETQAGSQEVGVDEQWKSCYLAYLEPLAGEIYAYRIEDINYDSVPEVVVWFNESLRSAAFLYINKNGQVKQSQTGEVHYNKDYVYCEGGISGVGHIIVYQYNENTGEYDEVCSGGWHEGDDAAVYEINNVECTWEEYSGTLDSYTQGEFQIVDIEEANYSGSGESDVLEVIKNL